MINLINININNSQSNFISLCDISRRFVTTSQSKEKRRENEMEIDLSFDI